VVNWFQTKRFAARDRWIEKEESKRKGKRKDSEKKTDGTEEKNIYLLLER